MDEAPERKAADKALTDCLDVLGRVRHLTPSSVYRSMSDEDRHAVFQEIRGGREHLLAVDADGQAGFSPRGPANTVFDLLEIIADHVGGPGVFVADQLTADLGTLDTTMNNLRAELSGVRVRFKHVGSIRDRVESLVLDQHHVLAGVESIDLLAVVEELRLREVGLQAALSTSARVLQPSLVDFLR
jgi:flagellar hook-associated protein 3 FlgL